MSLSVFHGKRVSIVWEDGHGPDQVINKLNGIAKDMRGLVAYRAVMAGGEQIQGQARINIHDTFSDKQTGGLSNSIAVTAETKGDGAEAEIAVNKEYARIQEFGGTIQLISPNQFLQFEIDGHMVRTRQVTLPARPYLEPAMETAKPKVIEAMSHVIQMRLKEA